uniref:Uncharacterized protein n=1 Tax=Cacopsylla melanoneura TaxID=428564 RepID=A0A8D9ACK9_9HEMI
MYRPKPKTPRTKRSETRRIFKPCPKSGRDRVSCVNNRRKRTRNERKRKNEKNWRMRRNVVTLKRKKMKERMRRKKKKKRRRKTVNLMTFAQDVNKKCLAAAPQPGREQAPRASPLVPRRTLCAAHDLHRAPISKPSLPDTRCALRQLPDKDCFRPFPAEEDPRRVNPWAFDRAVVVIRV